MARKKMILLFDKWDVSTIKVKDPSIARYIVLENRLVPHSFGRYNKYPFARAKLNLVERLINKLMRSGPGKRKLSGRLIRTRKACGKKLLVMKIVEEAFEEIEKRTKRNPVEVFIEAVQNAAPNEDVTRFSKGGIMYTEAVDVSSLRKVDEAVKNLALGAFAASFNHPKSVKEALVEEIIYAAQNDPKSYAVRRKDEIERIAKASR